MRARLLSLWPTMVGLLVALVGWNVWLRPQPGDGSTARSTIAPTKASPIQTAAPTATPTPAPAPRVRFRVVKVYPHDANAFTQGLLWDKGQLIEGTGRERLSSLRRVDLATGRVLQEQKLPPDVFGEGVTLAGNRLIQISWKNGRAFNYDSKTLRKTGEWTYEGEGWGLTFDGKNLIMSNGSDELSFRDPKTFAVVKSLPVTYNGQPLVYLNELEWIEGEIWANVWQSDSIARINPQTGVVKSYIDCKGLLDKKSRRGREDVLNGIAYDAQKKRIFLTGKLWPRLFEIELEKK